MQLLEEFTVLARLTITFHSIAISGFTIKYLKEIINNNNLKCLTIEIKRKKSNNVVFCSCRPLRGNSQTFFDKTKSLFGKNEN